MEASGDSEADMDPLTGHAILTIEEDAAADEDDTESCSHDPPDNIHTDPNNFNNNDDDDGVAVVIDDANMEHEGVMTWSPGEVTGLEEKEVVDSAEEDRLFWETCLASGYP
ncbi:putative phosphopantothenoylcysteine decarboxylase subunit VHS3 [Cocos nucifera]|uniref:Putative phosphopantothenoylcysteine decarboxylase subunit VHS3 n=1 Tax=Cocos nucifera TaxID=13894 RepID=A0A8K0HUD4_COCNU|nr:putative phosphopantothenoylcysteine decarboxylase subunit VHS3 [Cocos nucifera]